jgi:hypothetical protein
VVDEADFACDVCAVKSSGKTRASASSQQQIAANPCGQSLQVAARRRIVIRRVSGVECRSEAGEGSRAGLHRLERRSRIVDTALVALLCLALPLFWASRGFCGRRLGGLLRHCASGDPKGSGVLDLLLCHSVHRHRSRPSAFSDTWVPVSLPHVKPPADSLSIVSSAHLLAGDPFAATNGPHPSFHLTMRVFRGSLSGLLGAWKPPRC